MILKSSVTALLALAFATASHAAPVLTVTATFEPFLTSNTSIRVTNTSGSAETNVTLFSGGVSKLLGTIAAGSSASYVFNDVAGPFIVGAGNQGLSDTTTYRVTASLLGQTLGSNPFSPIANATGGYVDFLGSCYEFSVGCSVDPAGNYPLSAVVATAAVPEPATTLLLGAGVLGLAARRRR